MKNSNNRDINTKARTRLFESTPTCGELSCDECNARTAALISQRDDALARIKLLEGALTPFAQIGDIANDSDTTLWKRTVMAGDIRFARRLVLGEESKP